MYYRNFYINTYEVDKNKKLLVPTLLKYFQDTMIHNVDSFGASSEFHHKTGLAWVLIDYEIDIYKLPLGKTNVTCGTLPYSFKRFYGFRIWELKDEEGNLLAKAKGKFVLTNFITKDIVTPSKELLSMFKEAKQEPETLPFEKNIPLDVEVSSITFDTVKSTYIDVNDHMNNVYYLIVAYNNIPHKLLDSHFIEKIRITFKKECVIDDKLKIERRNLGNLYYFEIKKSDTILSKISIQLKKLE